MLYKSKRLLIKYKDENQKSKKNFEKETNHGSN